MDYSGAFNKAKALVAQATQSNFLLFFVVFLLALKIGFSVMTVNFPHNIFFADITKASLNSMINQARQSSGLPALKESAKLNQAAQLKAQNMLENNYFAHTSPQGVSPWYWFSKAGYSYKYAGENLAVGFFDSKDVYQAWLNSPSHRANILSSNYTEIGTAVLPGYGPGNAVVVVQEFASPLKKIAAAKPKPVQAVQENAPVAKDQPSAPKVLSEETEVPQNYIVQQAAKNGENVVQGAIYAMAFMMMGILLSVIFLSFEIQLKRKMAIRAALMLLLLCLAALADKDILLNFNKSLIII